MLVNFKGYKRFVGSQFLSMANGFTLVTAFLTTLFLITLSPLIFMTRLDIMSIQEEARSLLSQAGFAVIPLLYKGKLQSWEQLMAFCQENSAFTNELREGVVVKVCNGKEVLARFKMVRQGFIPGEHWSEQKITKNGLLS
jgi:hypothetical protein